MLVTVLVAYGVGAAVGLVMVERGSRQQWWRQAEMNAQIVSATMRSIYTSVVADANAAGQIVRLKSPLPIGDETSVLETGFDPVDVLALAAAQTRQDVWLLQRDASGRLVTIAEANGSQPGQILIPDEPSDDPTSLYVGFARLGAETYFVSMLPVVAPTGEVTGAVASSIGRRSALHEVRDALIRNSLLALLPLLAVTILGMLLLMRRVFRPVPVLIDALTRIANRDAGQPTPYRHRRDEIGRLAAAIETLREAVVEREQLRGVRETATRMEHMAHHDWLTGLPNRALLTRALDDALAGLLVGGTVNVMMMDLDGFKAVNDTCGHAVGDSLLVAVGERLGGLLGDGQFVARLGGDEFAIVQQTGTDGIAEASTLALRVVEAIGTPFQVDGHTLRIGTSVGVACAPLHGETAQSLLANADAALYVAKRRGRGYFVFFTPGMVMTRGVPAAVGPQEEDRT